MKSGLWASHLKNSIERALGGDGLSGLQSWQSITPTYCLSPSNVYSTRTGSPLLSNQSHSPIPLPYTLVLASFSQLHIPTNYKTLYMDEPVAKLMHSCFTRWQARSWIGARMGLMFALARPQSKSRLQGNSLSSRLRSVEQYLHSQAAIPAITTYPSRTKCVKMS